MAIKKVLAENMFRSLPEIDKFLSDLKTKLDDVDSLLKQYQSQFARQTATLEFKINTDKPTDVKTFKSTKVDKIVIPKIDTLRKNFAIVQELSDTVAELDTVYNNVSVNFRSLRGSADLLKKIKALKASAEVKMNRALSFLDTVGNKYAPTQFKDIVQSTMNFLVTVLDYKKSTNYLYAFETPTSDIAFCFYVKLSNLVDDDGEQYPEMYLAFTNVLKAKSADKSKLDSSYYVTTLNSFSVPNSFSFGKEVSNQSEAVAAISSLLDLDNVSNAIGIIPHGLDPSKVVRKNFKDSTKIARIIVEPTAFIFELIKSVKKAEANSIISSLYMDIKGLVSKVKGANIKVKITNADGRYTIRYSLSNLATENQVSTNDLDWLQERFNLSDDKLRKIVRELNG